MRCDIISPIWNQKERTQRCIESIIEHTHYPYRLILIDNGSEEPARRYLDHLASDPRLNVLLIRNEENLGNIKAVNQGMRASDAPFVCIQDNDTIVTEGWLTEMIHAFSEEPEAGIVNPMSNNSGWYARKGETLDQFAAHLKQTCGGRYSEMATAVGYCFLIKREVIEKIGYWDETFGMGYYEDRDYSLRAAQAGFKIINAKGAYVYHEEHSSFRIRPERQALQQKNRTIFEARWGRPRRYLYLLTEPDASLAERVLLEAYQKARENHFVWIFTNERCLPMDFVDHSNIDIFVFPQYAWLPVMLWRILKRKKKFYSIRWDRQRDFYALRLFRFLHRAELMPL